MHHFFIKVADRDPVEVDSPHLCQCQWSDAAEMQRLESLILFITHRLLQVGLQMSLKQFQELGQSLMQMMTVQRANWLHFSA